MAVNDTKFKPGQSGNPKGRPKGAKTGLKATMMRFVNQEAKKELINVFKEKGFEFDQKDYAEIITATTIVKAVKGDLKAIKLLMEAEPKEVNLTHEGGVLVIPPGQGSVEDWMEKNATSMEQSTDGDDDSEEENK